MAGQLTPPSPFVYLLFTSTNSDVSVLAISKAKRSEPASSQTPTIDSTVQHVGSASRNDQLTLRAKVSIVPMSSQLVYFLVYLINFRSLSESSTVVQSRRRSTTLV